MRKIFVVMLALLLLGCIAGCGQKSDDHKDEPDVHTLADKLMSGLTFEDSVSEVLPDVALKYYGIDSAGIVDCDVHISTGATSEEVAVFEAQTAIDAQSILDVMKTRQDTQIKTYFEYNSNEVSRLDDAVVEAHDRFVVYVVSNDSAKAEEIIRGYLE